VPLNLLTPVSEAQAAETRARLKSFEEDWNAPGMEGYDAL